MQIMQHSLPPLHSSPLLLSLLSPPPSLHPLQVKVDRVDNVPGKEFRALLISTIRTCSTELSNSKEEVGFLTSPKVSGHVMI